MRIALALGFVVASTTPAAAGKPRLLVLGVEADKTQDAQVKAARDVTLALRARAKTSPMYVLAPDDKQLADERAKHACDSEAPDCMLEIAAAYKADAVVWGRLGGDSLVTLKAIRAGKHDVIVVSAQLPDGDPAPWATAAYQTLLVPSGTLEIKANVPTATVTIEGADKLVLANGTGQRVLAEGRYKIKVEAAGHTPLVTTVVIKESETATLNVELAATK